MRSIFVGAAISLTLVIGAIAFVAVGTDTEAGSTSVDETGLDLDPTGNTATSVGTVDSALSNAALNTPITIDVYAKGVPGPSGLFGVGFELIYDPAFINVIGNNTNVPPNSVLQTSQAPGTVIFGQSDIDTNPGDDFDGSFRLDHVAGGPQETGSGRLAQIVIQCIAEGVSDLTLQDNNTGGGSTIGVLYSTPAPGGTYTVDSEIEAIIGCGTEVVTPTPGTVTPVDTSTVTAPPTGGTVTATPPTETPVNTVTPTAEPGTITPPPTETPVNTVTPTAEPGTITPPPTVTPTEPATVTPTEPAGTSRLWGDWDCDGEITTRDNQALLRRVLSQNPLTQTEPCPDIGSNVTIDGTSRLWGDSDCDGEISTRDNQALLRRVLSQGALTQTEPCPDLGSTVQQA